MKYWTFEIIFTDKNIKDSTNSNIKLWINKENWLPNFIHVVNWSIKTLNWHISEAKLKIDKNWLIKIYLPTIFNQKINWKPILEDASIFMHIDKNKIN